MNRPPKLLFVSMLGEPGKYRASLFDEIEGGDDEVFWFKSMMAHEGFAPSLTIDGIFHARGEALPPQDNPATRYDAVIVGGSFHSVHDDLPWQRSLWQWMQRLRDASMPVFGICGAHQLISLKDGGHVDGVPNAPRHQTETIKLTEAGKQHPLFDGVTDLRFHFGNSERVAEAPPGATILAQSMDMPVMALDHGGGWVSVQFHPELSAKTIGASWADTRPEFVNLYDATPEAPRLFANFLKAGGIIG